MKSTGRKYGKQASSLFHHTTGRRTPRYFSQPTKGMQQQIDAAKSHGTIITLIK